MTPTRIKATVPLLALAALATLTLSACGGEDDPAANSGDEVVTDSTLAGTDDSGTDDGFVGVTLPGTGEWTIGLGIPYGGFQLLGEPAEQPEGCTWAILDEDRNVVVENQGVYVWLTDVPESVTFVSDGCPDWEQFE